MHIRDIQAAKAEKLAAMKALTDAPLTAESRAKFDTLETEAAALSADEKRMAKMADLERGAPAVVTGDRSDTAEALERRVNPMNLVRAQVEPGKYALSGAEAEYHAQKQRDLGPAKHGLYAPLRAVLETRGNTVANSGQLVGTDHLASHYVDALRSPVIARAGVNVLPAQRENLAIPKAANTTATNWIVDGGTIAESVPTFSSIALSPKLVAGKAYASPLMLVQSQPSIDRLFHAQMAADLARKVEAATFKGGGANEPTGITAEMGAANATLAGPTWAQVLKMIEQVENANALSPDHVFVMGPNAKAKLMATLKAGTDAGAGYIIEGGKIAGYPVLTSSYVPGDTVAGTNGVLFGAFNEVFLAPWREVEIFAVRDPATAGAFVTAFSAVDIACRHIEAFAWADDVPALV